MKTILVVANETLGGRELLDKIKEHAAEEDIRVAICVPQTRPRHGNIIYDEAVYDAAQVRIELARSVLRREGIDAVGEPGDPDPYTATMDAVSESHPDLIIISTFPATSSGWLRRDLVERVADASSVPVEHVVADIDNAGLPFQVTLVVANVTAGRGDLRARMKELAAEADDMLFIVVVPLQAHNDGRAAAVARARLGNTLDRMRREGLRVAGMLGDPDPYTATMNALQFFHVSRIVISTLPVTKSGWMRSDLIERVRRASNVEVEHVIAEVPAESTR
jgi:hypothetical protein